MQCISQDERVSWRSVVNGPLGPAWYRPVDYSISWNGRPWYPYPQGGYQPQLKHVRGEAVPERVRPKNWRRNRTRRELA